MDELYPNISNKPFSLLLFVFIYLPMFDFVMCFSMKYNFAVFLVLSFNWINFIHILRTSYICHMAPHDKTISTFALNSEIEFEINIKSGFHSIFSQIGIISIQVACIRLKISWCSFLRKKDFSNNFSLQNRLIVAVFWNQWKKNNCSSCITVSASANKYAVSIWCDCVPATNRNKSGSKWAFTNEIRMTLCHRFARREIV